jgi:hypothetical protein
LRLYCQRGAIGTTDAEASDMLGILRWCVPSRRLAIGKHVRLVPVGERDGCVAWALAEPL